MQQSAVIVATLVVYKLALIGVGLWASRRTRDASDFFIGARGLGPVVAGLSYAASTSSAWVLLGFSGFVYAVGLSALWMVPGIWAGYAVVWLWFGPRLRAESSERRHTTLTDFLAAGASGPARRAIMALAAVLIVVCFVFYIAAQFDAAAKAFVEQLGIGAGGSVLLGAAIILVYCLLGGFWAVSVTDTLQGFVMVCVAVGLPLVALAAAGGPAALYATLGEVAPPAYLDWGGGRSGLVLAGFVLGLATIGLGTLGQPHLLNRLMAVRDERARRQGFAVAMSWGVLVYLGMALLALAGRALTPALADGEQLFYRLAGELLPLVLAGVVIAAILSAVMSTVDSILLVAASAVAHDLGMTRRFPARELVISRLAMTAIAAVAVALTLYLPDSIFNRVLFAWSALGAAFGPVVVARVAGHEPRPWAVFAAIAAGFATTALFYALGTLPPAAAAGGGALATLVGWAQLPGDPFERVVPWVPALALLFLWHRPSRGRSGDARARAAPEAG